MSKRHVGPAGRRKFLKTTAGLALASSFAGCTGGDGGDGGSGDGGSGDGGGGGDGGDGGSGDGGDGVDFPERDITFIIPYSTGGGFDTYSRLMSKHMPKHLPQEVNVVPQNITGGSGQVGTERAYASDADGYTIFTFSNFTQLFNQIVKDANYDLSNVTQFPQYTTGIRGIYTGVDTGLETWDDTVEAIRNEEVKIGTTTGLGVGLIIAGIASQSDVFTVDQVVNNFVPYPGGTGDIVAGMNRGDVQVTANSYSSALPYVESGDYRCVLVCTNDDAPPEELSEFQDAEAETFQTAGIPNGQSIQDMISITRFVAGPPGIPEERATILREAITATLHDDEFLADAEEANRPIVYADSETAAQVVQNSHENWSRNRELLERMSGLG